MITPSKADEKIKIILAGPHNAGKSMFVWKFCQTSTEFKAEPTIGATFVCHNVEVAGKVYKVHIWDTAGQETYHSITAPYFRSSSGVLLLFDLTDLSSFNTLNDWFQMIEANTRTMPLVYVLGNKCDQEEARVIPREDAEELCLSRGAKYWETSAVTGSNVQQAVRELITQIAQMRGRVETDFMGPPLRYRKKKSCC